MVVQNRLFLDVFNFDKSHKNDPDPDRLLVVVRFEPSINTTKAHQQIISLPSTNIINLLMSAKTLKIKIKETKY